MVIRRDLLALALLALVACSHERPEHPSARAQDTAVAQDPTGPLPSYVWANYGTEAPSFCLLLHPDGSARFVGGFLFFNPLRWSYTPAGRVLSLTIPAFDKRNIAGLNALDRAAFDSVTKTFHYALISRYAFRDQAGRVRATTVDSLARYQASWASFDFMGWRLQNPDSVDDDTYAHMREGCPAVLPRRSPP